MVLNEEAHLRFKLLLICISCTRVFQHSPERCRTLAGLLLPSGSFLLPGDRQGVNLACYLSLAPASLFDLNRVLLANYVPDDSLG